MTAGERVSKNAEVEATPGTVSFNAMLGDKALLCENGLSKPAIAALSTAAAGGVALLIHYLVKEDKVLQETVPDDPAQAESATVDEEETF